MNYADRFNEEFQKALESKEYPVGTVSTKWRLWAIEALKHASILSLGINPDDWFGLLDTEETRKMSLYQFALLSNNLQNRSPEQLGLDLKAYGLLMQEADDYVKVWNEATKDLRKEVEEKLQEELQMQKAAEGRSNILKPVKAEA